MVYNQNTIRKQTTKELHMSGNKLAKNQTKKLRKHYNKLAKNPTIWGGNKNEVMSDEEYEIIEHKCADMREENYFID